MSEAYSITGTNWETHLVVKVFPQCSHETGSFTSGWHVLNSRSEAGIPFRLTSSAVQVTVTLRWICQVTFTASKDPVVGLTLIRDAHVSLFDPIPGGLVTVLSS